MGDLRTIAEYKADKLKRLEREWNDLMERVGELKRLGKYTFAESIMKKAVKLRIEIDKLRKPKAALNSGVQHHEPYLRMPNIIFTGSADLGYPKTTPPPPPTTTPEPEAS